MTTKGFNVGFLIGLLQAIATAGIIALIIFLVANLLLIVFSLGTMFDRRISND